MNSATKPARVFGLLALLAAVAAFGLLASGCGDYGPTNMYSKPLFGQTQSGASMHFYVVHPEWSLSTTPGVGPDQYVVAMKNVGSGGLIGPVSMTVTVGATSPNTCGGGVSLEGYTKQPGDPGAGATAVSSQLVTFGYPGQAIYPGDAVVGKAATPAGGGYSFQVGFVTATAGCSYTAQTFTYTASDSKGDAWSGTFNGTNE